MAGRGHLFQSELPQRETAWPAGQAVDQILRVDRDFAGGAEEPGVAGNSAHAPGSWIVYHSAEHDALIILGGCDAARARIPEEEIACAGALVVERDVAVDIDRA